MTEIYFDWDPEKAASNLKKHGITFEMAMQVFFDPFVVRHQDRVVDGEERWQSIGLVEGYILLMVAHTTWEEDEYGQFYEVVRIISAREATRHERRRYEEGGD